MRQLLSSCRTTKTLLICGRIVDTSTCHRCLASCLYVQNGSADVHRWRHSSNQWNMLNMTSGRLAVSQGLLKWHPTPQMQQRATLITRLTGSKWSSKHKADGVNKKQIMIYVNGNSSFLFGTYFVSSIALSLTIVSACLRFPQMTAADKMDLMELEGQIPGAISMLVTGTLLVGGMRLLGARTLLRIYYDAETDTYTAVLYDWLLRKKQFVFKKEHLKTRDVSKNIFGQFYGNTLISGKPYYIQDFDFKDNRYYNMLMGHINQQKSKSK